MIAMTKFFRQYLLGILATSLSLVAVEPSAYSAGDLSLKNPYGLTSAEKQILADREMIEKLEQRVKALESTQKGLSESLDGVKSLYEGNAQQTNRLKSLLKLSDRVNELNSSVELLNNRLDESIKVQNTNAEKTAKAINALGKSIDELNVSSAPHNNVAVTTVPAQQHGRDVNTTLVPSAPTQKAEVNSSINKTPKPELNSVIPTVAMMQKSDKEVLYKQGMEAFTNNALARASTIFTYLGKQSYKADASWFYVGEVAFKEGDDRSAVESYQKSLDVNSNSAYAPKILLHTGEALERSGDSKASLKVYQALIESFPSSKEAKEAKKRLPVKR